MGGVRRAFLWASFGRYVVMAINLSAVIILARLIPPAGFGISVLGTSAFALAEAAREIAGGSYLVQQRELSIQKIRTTITTSLFATLAIAASFYVGAGIVARFYDVPELVSYMHVLALGYILGPFIYPILALMSREMAFGHNATISISMSLAGALTSTGLAVLGFDYMSLAWGSVVSALVGSCLCFAFRPDLSIYKLSFSEWRGVVGFGVFDSATALIASLGENLPYLVLGRLLDPGSVAIAQRAVLLSAFPERVLLAGASTVALPALAKSVREDSDTKAVYLRAIELVTVLQWPCLILLAVLATPLVTLLLGSKWLEVVPLLRILCIAAAFSFPWALQYPALVALGAVKLLPRLVGLQALVNTLAIGLAAQHGLQAAAWSLVVAVPVNAAVAVAAVRRHLGFQWIELGSAILRSAAVCSISGIGPIVVLWAQGGPNVLSNVASLLAAFLAGVGWLIGVWLTRHPAREELLRLAKALQARTNWARASET